MLVLAAETAYAQQMRIKLPARFTLQVIRTDFSEVITTEADSAIALHNDAFAFSRYGKWKVIDRSDTIDADSLKKLTWGAYLLYINGVCYLDAPSFKESLLCEFAGLSEDKAWVRATDKLGFYQVHLPSGVVTRVSGIVEGVNVNQPIRCFEEHFGYYYMDWDFNKISSWHYSYGTAFEDNLAIVELQYKVGALNTKGEWQIKPKYDWLKRVSSYRFLGKIAKEFKLVDAVGKVLWEGADSLYLDTGFLGLIDSVGLYGAVDYTGCELFRGYKYPVVLDQGSYIADAGTYISVKDTNGAIMYGPKSNFTLMERGDEELYRVRKKGKYGFANREGITRVPCRYEAMGALRNGKIPVKIQNRWGTVTKGDEIVIQPVYASLSSFCDRICIAEKDQKWYVFDDKGKSLLQDDITKMQETSSGGYILQQNGKYGFVNSMGTIVLQAVYDEIIETIPKVLFARLNKSWAIYDSKGALRQAAKYQLIQADLSTGYIFMYK